MDAPFVKLYISKQTPRRYIRGVIRGRLEVTTEPALALPIPNVPEVLKAVAEQVKAILNTNVEYETP